MSFFYDLNKKLDSIRATPEVTHKQLNERDMSREGKALDPVRKKYDKYDNTEVDEGVMDTVKSVGKKVASGINKLVGHGSDEDMRKDVQRKAGAPVTGKKPEQKTTEAAKYRDPKYKDKLYTVEPLDYTYGPDADELYYNPKPDDYEGRKRKIGGSEFDHNDPLQKGQGIGRSGIKNNILDRGPRKGLPSRDQITSLKGSIKDAHGTHAQPNLPEAAGSIDFDKVLDAIAALYGDDMWENDAMQDLANDLEQAGPTDRELDFIIAKGKLPKRLAGIQFSAGDNVRFGEAASPMTAKQKTFADKIAGAKKEVDEMLGDVAAEAMRSALGGGRGRNAEMDEERSKGTAFDMSTPRDAAPKAGSTERGHKHDITHGTTDPRYKGRTVIRRTDAQGNSVDADDASDDEGNKKEKRTKAGRPDGTGKKIGAKGPSGKSKLMTKEDDHQDGELKAAMTLLKKAGYKVSKAESTDTRDDHAEKAGKKVAKDIEHDEKNKDNIHGKKRGPEDAKAEKAGKKVAKDIEHDEKKKKEEDVEESTTAGSVATSTATKSSKGGMVGKGIYDSFNRELENMIAESMTINMSDSTEGGKSLTITATDEDALKLGMLLKNAGLGGGDAHGGDMHSSGEQPCATCGMPDCGCGDVQEAVDENSPDYPTNTEQANNNFGYAGGLDGPKSTGQSTVPVLASQDDRQHSYAAEEEDAIKRMMEMAGLAEGNMPMVKKDGKMVPAFAADGKGKNDLEAKDKEEDTVEESIRRMMEIAGVKKKPMDEQKTEEGNLFTKGLEDDDVKIGDKIPGTNAIKKKDIDESIFALTNQWQAYKG